MLPTEDPKLVAELPTVGRTAALGVLSFAMVSSLRMFATVLWVGKSGVAEGMLDREFGN